MPGRKTMEGREIKNSVSDFNKFWFFFLRKKTCRDFGWEARGVIAALCWSLHFSFPFLFPAFYNLHPNNSTFVDNDTSLIWGGSHACNHLVSEFSREHATGDQFTHSHSYFLLKFSSVSWALHSSLHSCCQIMFIM